MGLTINSPNKTKKVTLNDLKSKDCFEFETQYYVLLESNDIVQDDIDGYLKCFCFDTCQVDRVILTATVIQLNLEVTIGQKEKEPDPTT